MNKRHTAVLVAGSWGTALASVLADNGQDVILWSRNAEQVEEINRLHTNSRFLPDAVLPERIRATTSLEEAVKGADAVLIASPSKGMREVAGRIQPYLSPDALLLHAAKGFEADTLKRMTTVIAEELPAYDSERIVVISGPSHAEEVVRRIPTTIVVAAVKRSAADRAQDLLNNSSLRVYTNPDVLGVELGGALKNIIALGAGLSDGLGYGDNAKAALMTRGLAEISRLGAAMGANPLTFSGLAGVGDLIVTCTSRHSRNWRAGHMIGQGHSLEETLAVMGMVVEGVKTTKAARDLAHRHGVEMPITEALYRVLFEEMDPKSAVEELMDRLPKHEAEEAARAAVEAWPE
ncbi:glycerol-3-phosphate dehydrogenase [NAD(P)+] [Paenibacillus sp. J31TS4]|uniref:NAD(P)H-dependent glycerol-3-phosphate dehydrogenase n=1 Tax=Paenibacillus sp. J31TS4 TaxID=2807195 RepID=UPI001B1444DE|nr:NAD(P)H-dependent glycerol-3-phosphate dehydrogenase [Paenibacillus sp. J31TS4]GIP37486.1 glycerol-3-phosphate dehydrogenase [NAD(P)+] [Paenibacillus sp. J31TS4]